ncbi:MerR family transcriptional regulator [Sphingomonas sabuli]|uniref:MerR family transcriptional regulator n=1 Tax=Sphingomonas sabuli TaxID=2764186 RepID=A0A7G9L0X9_9SPHN|nr:MerR family transcriptional regulator [Sphingomonas sabuli]QNM82278.1 MerR family transcriptional regulator [Sphingomonas sabuli]
MATGEKAPGAFKTIGELSAQLGIAQHILRYWETKFPQLKPLQRAGNRRYYRPDDVQLAVRIHRLLNEEGYTVRGVQKLLRQRDGADAPDGDARPLPRPDSAPSAAPVDVAPAAAGIPVDRLVRLRDRLAAALED